MHRNNFPILICGLIGAFQVLLLLLLLQLLLVVVVLVAVDAFV
jgi:hypothetical protein